MPANPIPLNATARTWVATRVRRLEGPQLAPPSWQYAGQSHLQHSTARMEAMVFNDRFRCDAAYVLDGTMDWSVFAKRSMSPQLVVVGSILRQDPA